MLEPVQRCLTQCYLSFAQGNGRQAGQPFSDHKVGYHGATAVVPGGSSALVILVGPGKLGLTCMSDLTGDAVPAALIDGV